MIAAPVTLFGGSIFSDPEDGSSACAELAPCCELRADVQRWQVMRQRRLRRRDAEGDGRDRGGCRNKRVNFSLISVQFHGAQNTPSPNVV